MAEKSGFFNGSEYDATDWADYFSDLVETGILDKTALNLQVRAGTGMSIIAQPGKAWINGFGYANDSNKTLSMATSNGSFNRVDNVVLRYDVSVPVIKLMIITGTPSSAPQAPDIIRSSAVYDLKLAEVLIKKGSTSISQSDIKDTRFDTNLCGIVKSPASRIDTTDLFVQYSSAFSTWFELIKGQLTTDQAGNLQAQINKIIDATNTNETNISSAQGTIQSHTSSISSLGSRMSTNETRIGNLQSSEYYASGVGQVSKLAGGTMIICGVYPTNGLTIAF